MSKPLPRQIALQMERFIQDGTWPLHEKIPSEMMLMEQFNTSRNTIREAVQSLIHAGLLESKRGSGTRVKATNPLQVLLTETIQKHEWHDILEVRYMLETEAAPLAAIRRTEEQLKRIQHAYTRCEKATTRKQFLEADFHFHEAIVYATNNPLFIELYEHIATSVERSIAHLLEETSVAHLHTALLQAIEQQNPTKAKQEVTIHYASQWNASQQEEL